MRIVMEAAHELGLALPGAAQVTQYLNALYDGVGNRVEVDEVALAVVREREDNGPFNSLIDFCSRIDSQEANKKVIESLVRAGAFDSIDEHRARLFNGVDFAMARAMNTLPRLMDEWLKSEAMTAEQLEIMVGVLAAVLLIRFAVGPAARRLARRSRGEVAEFLHQLRSVPVTGHTDST